MGLYYQSVHLPHPPAVTWSGNGVSILWKLVPINYLYGSKSVAGRAACQPLLLAEPSIS